jgi:hypothetical protein
MGVSESNASKAVKFTVSMTADIAGMKGAAKCSLVHASWLLSR